MNTVRKIYRLDIYENPWHFSLKFFVMAAAFGLALLRWFIHLRSSGISLAQFVFAVPILWFSTLLELVLLIHVAAGAGYGTFSALRRLDRAASADKFWNKLHAPSLTTLPNPIQENQRQPDKEG